MTNQANEHSPNLIASVQQRLRNIAQQRRTDYRLILERYAGERLLYRVSQSPYRDQLILKGATLLYLWTKQEFRATRDVDFLGFGSTDLEAIRQMMTEICRVEYAEDGLRFQGGTIGVEDILDEQEYGGVRAKLKAYLGTTRIHLQVDIGFGDVVTPNPIEQEYPTLLGHSAPKLKTYPRETFIAEKFEAMVRLGPMNSRMKDFWDVAALAQQFTFKGSTLQTAIKGTFERRDTPLTQEVPDALRTTFYQNQDKSNQWQAFLTRTQPQLAVPPTFNAVGELVRSFLNPIRESILDDRPFTQEWLAGGSWQSEGVSKTGGIRNTKTEVKAKELEASLKTPPRRFKPYPAYKDSKVECVGEVPAHWEARRLKTIALVQPSNVDKKSVEGQEPVRLCNYLDVYYHEKITRDLEFMAATATAEQIRRFSLRSGDVLITKDSETPDDIAVPSVVGEDLPGVICGYHLAHIRPIQSEVNGRFLARAFSAIGLRDQFHVGANGITRFGLTGNTIRSSVFWLGPLEEQRAISAFLDREIGKIDALIQKKERLIELLKQKRTALITRAVTKGLPAEAAAKAGLNPNVPMRDSGIEWLGEIPAHWEVKRLKRISPKQNVGLVINPSTYVNDEGSVPFFFGSDISPFRINTEEVRRITEESNRELASSMLRSGDLVTVRVGAPGVTAVVPTELDRSNCASMMIIRHHNSFSSHWLCYAINSRIGGYQVELVQYGAAQKQFNIAHAVNFTFPVPPFIEQEDIARHLNDQLANLDSLISKIREGIDRLKEFRTTLISAAVTGKIDVREDLNKTDEANIPTLVGQGTT